MGWLFSYGITEKKDMVADRIKSWESKRERDGVEIKVTGVCLAHTVHGNSLWTVWEIAKTFFDSKELISIDRYIGLDLLRKEDGCYGYKDMCEADGPCYYDCPVKFLKLVPLEPETIRQEWRAKVLEFHANKKKKHSIKVGDTIRLKNANIPEIVVTVKDKSKIYGTFEGQIYKIAPRFIGEIISA